VLQASRHTSRHSDMHIEPCPRQGHTDIDRHTDRQTDRPNDLIHRHMPSRTFGDAGSTIVPTSTASAAERGKTGRDSEQLRGRSVTGGEWKPCMPSASPLMTWSSSLSSATGAATPLAPQVSHITLYGLVCDKLLAKAAHCYVSLFTAAAHLLAAAAHRSPAHH